MTKGYGMLAMCLLKYIPALYPLIHNRMRGVLAPKSALLGEMRSRLITMHLQVAKHIRIVSFECDPASYQLICKRFVWASWALPSECYPIFWKSMDVRRVFVKACLREGVSEGVRS